MTPLLAPVRLGSLLGALLLVACTGSLLPTPSPPPTRLTLDGGASAPKAAPTPTTTATPTKAPTITVETPRAAPGYDSARMLYLRRPPALEAFALHEWVATPAQMLAPLLVHALDRGGAYRVVLAPTSAGAGTWRLETTLLRLHQDFTQHPSRMRLTLRAVLIHTATRQAMAGREFDISVDAASDDPVAGALAAQTAAQRLASDVAAFCAEAVTGPASDTSPGLAQGTAQPLR